MRRNQESECENSSVLYNKGKSRAFLQGSNALSTTIIYLSRISSVFFCSSLEEQNPALNFCIFVISVTDATALTVKGYYSLGSDL